jgi:hypothetical protein
MYFSQPPKKQYKYKSLSDVYTENVNIMGVDSTGTQEELGAVSDDYYPTLRRLVASKAENGVEALVKQLLRLCEWDDVPDQIDDPVLNIMLKYDIDVKTLTKIVEKKKAGDLGKLEKCINKKGKWNLLDAVDPLAKKLTKNFNKMFGELTRHKPTIATVGVGPGEISLSMFTNANKADVNNDETGDLDLNGIGIEVKGDGGRLGSSDYTKGIGKDGQFKYIDQLMTMATPRHFSEFEAPQLKDAALKSASDLVKKITATSSSSFIIKVFQAIDDDLDEGKTLGDSTGLKSSLDALAVDLNNLPDTIIDPTSALSTITTKMDSILETYPHLNDLKTARGNKNSIMNDYGRLISTLSKLIESTLDKREYNWQSSAQYMFLYDWGMTPRELATTFVEMRTEPLEDEVVKSLINALENIFLKPDFVKSLQKGETVETKKMLQMLQVALMSTSYHYVHKFERLLALDSKFLNAANIVFDLDKTAGELLTDVYSQLKKGESIYVSNAGVDSRNKGIGISVK